MFCRVAFATVFTIAATSPSWGGEPVEFDTRPLLPCREVKAPEQTAATHKVVAAVIPPSVLICHWTNSAVPLAAAVNVTGWPTVTD